MFEFQHGAADSTVSGDSIVDSPSNNLDRQLKLQTLLVFYGELMMIGQAAEFSIVVTDQLALRVGVHDDGHHHQITTN